MAVLVLEQRQMRRHFANEIRFARCCYDHLAGQLGVAVTARLPALGEGIFAELGIDLADRKPQLITTELAEWADVVVTMGCGDECPYVPGRRYLDWDLPDPKRLPVAQVRVIRDEIGDRVQALAGELG